MRSHRIESGQLPTRGRTGAFGARSETAGHPATQHRTRDPACFMYSMKHGICPSGVVERASIRGVPSPMFGRGSRPLHYRRRSSRSLRIVRPCPNRFTPPRPKQGRFPRECVRTGFRQGSDSDAENYGTSSGSRPCGETSMRMSLTKYGLVHTLQAMGPISKILRSVRVCGEHFSVVQRTRSRELRSRCRFPPCAARREVGAARANFEGRA